MSGDIAQLVRDVRQGAKGSTRAAARLMSMLENHPERIPALYVGSADWPEPRMVLGFTGPPGAGKSTLVDRMVALYRKRHPQRRIGVIAVDPSSPFTGGAVMGDRVRMMRHATDPLVFVRSLASRGHLGGLTLGVKGVLRVMGLTGCELILIETVGVGQSEVEVAAIADLVAIILAPGQGDGIQLLKSGLMEAGDVFVVNKGDREGAAQLQAQLRTTLNLMASIGEQRRPVHMCVTSALEDKGVVAFLDLLEECYARDGDQWRARRTQRVEQEVEQAVLEEARRRLVQTLGANGSAAVWARNVLRGEATVGELAGELLRQTVHKQF